jgi:phosphatidylserine/phosphatidylglycerophosphate/cardiolipin synthase-like enzyme
MKKKILIAVIMLILLITALQSAYAVDLIFPKDTSVNLYFSPKGGCTQAIIKEIDDAKSEILVQAYSFTSAPIAKALLNAHKRGIKVEVILDKSQRSERYTSATFLVNAGILAYIDAKHAIAHNKIMIIDRETVITGSFNFTKAAEEKNAENLLIIRNKETAKVYIENWYKHKEHSERYSRD